MTISILALKGKLNGKILLLRFFFFFFCRVYIRYTAKKMSTTKNVRSHKTCIINTCVCLERTVKTLSTWVAAQAVLKSLQGLGKCPFKLFVFVRQLK